MLTERLHSILLVCIMISSGSIGLPGLTVKGPIYAYTKDNLDANGVIYNVNIGDLYDIAYAEGMNAGTTRGGSGGGGGNIIIWR